MYWCIVFQQLFYGHTIIVLYVCTGLHKRACLIFLWSLKCCIAHISTDCLGLMHMVSYICMWLVGRMPCLLTCNRCIRLSQDHVNRYHTSKTVTAPAGLYCLLTGIFPTLLPVTLKGFVPATKITGMTHKCSNIPCPLVVWLPQ